MKKEIKHVRRLRRKRSIRNKIVGSGNRPRLTVYRSAGHIYAQIIDDEKRQTVISAASTEKELSERFAAAKNKTEKSSLLGKVLAERALAKDIASVVFDRNGYGYHGRIKALAEAAREGGLVF